ncbi:gamma-aminobutyric acid receptor subunit alpha-6 [Plakobranchus ocellatus]|uniref:Gamma-aminobutyric acid receptor subunit alpha-6 n=1 Tax=Plakobranchus ocellatus TaxID=259542 RepID=A0AAV4APP9_9GAST|nr:gamma-aminobutyric acid receptor subunit alpha-6 [Plakobranchus ocellatus]
MATNFPLANLDLDTFYTHTQIYSMDCYFRQVWIDRRLAFNATDEQVSNVSLNLKMLERIWHPDTYFINGGPSYVHTITTPNKFIRLSQDGTILYSQRLTIKANCPMHLEKFPMDSQLCPLYIGSCAHSILTVFFDFRRHTGFFLIQVYLPCCLLVILSWVSFWINREATSDRISLGATTMLTMTFLVLDTRNDLPRVAYSTALDVYVALCFFFVFASIVQFAAVHFFTKYGSADNDFKTTLLLDTDDSDDDEDLEAEDAEDPNRFQPTSQASFRPPNGHTNLRPDSLTACIRKMWTCLLSTRAKRFNKNVRNALGLNSVSKIDQVSRVLFPSAFLGLNIVYWISYW